MLHMLYYVTYVLLCTIQLYTFEKKAVPNDEEEKEMFIESLAKYGVSLKKYIAQLSTPKKRSSEQDIAPEPRRSPRLSEGGTSVHVSGNQAKRNLFQN